MICTPISQLLGRGPPPPRSSPPASLPAGQACTEVPRARTGCLNRVLCERPSSLRLCCHLAADMCKGGEESPRMQRGMNDLTFEQLPDFSCFWFGRRGPERCFLLGDLLPLIMVQVEWFILTFSREKESWNFKPSWKDPDCLGGYLCFYPQPLEKKRRPTLKPAKTNK